METQGFALFDTAIGRCGVAWGRAGVLGVQLPESNERATRARIARRFPQADETTPPPAVRRAIDGMTAVLAGKRRSLASVALDFDAVPPFHRQVYTAARTIPAGATLSYGEIAQRIGAPKSARAVGQALGRNPFPIIVPCHRVLAAGGKVGGFTADGGTTTKLRMLTIEGARVSTPRSTAARPIVGFDPHAAVAHLRAADKPLARLIERVGAFDLETKSTASVFAALGEAIVYQQLSGKAAATIFGRVCDLFPGRTKGFTPENLSRVADEPLRAAGLSRAKLLALRDLADKSRDGTVPPLARIRRMPDDEIIERLTAVRGIGRWTVEMLLIFRLGRPDVLPADDFGVRKGFALTFALDDLPTKAALLERGARWAPYRSVASWYLWRAADLAKA